MHICNTPSNLCTLYKSPSTLSKLRNIYKILREIMLIVNILGKKAQCRNALSYSRTIQVYKSSYETSVSS